MQPTQTEPCRTVPYHAVEKRRSSACSARSGDRCLTSKCRESDSKASKELHATLMSNTDWSAPLHVNFAVRYIYICMYIDWFPLYLSLQKHLNELYSTKSLPFLWEHATQLLVQALVLSRLDYCTALLAGLPASSIRPLQLIQNAAARLIFNEPKRTHVTPLFINLHWLPIAAQCIRFKH